MTDLDAKIRAKLSPVYDPPWAMKQYRAALTAVLDRHDPGLSSLCAPSTFNARYRSTDDPFPIFYSGTARDDPR